MDSWLSFTLDFPGNDALMLGGVQVTECLIQQKRYDALCMGQGSAVRQLTAVHALRLQGAVYLYDDETINKVRTYFVYNPVTNVILLYKNQKLMEGVFNVNQVLLRETEAQGMLCTMSLENDGPIQTYKL